MQFTPKLVLTPGEPSGIGPELAIKACQVSRPFELIAVSDPTLLQQTATNLGLPLNLKLHVSGGQPGIATAAGELSIIPVATDSPVKPGKLDVRNAPYVIETLTQAAKLCLNGSANALVTGPVQKSIISESGIPFSGHTEFFADISHTAKVVMMLATPSLRVALATTHLPLKEVSNAITKESLNEVINILWHELKFKFGVCSPKILICGLNPHAGEDGHLGMEEIDTIIPVLNACRSKGMDLVGPLPADTLFTPSNLQGADAVLAMYHDQGLPVLKSQGFGEAVNITLGLPFIRTSVDHGTALDLAGKGIAKTDSLEVALDYAYRLSLASEGLADSL